METQLLLKIAEKAIKFPKTSVMAIFAGEAEVDEAHPCGAVACICGTAVLLTDPEKFKRMVVDQDANWKIEGMRALDINESEAERLFDRFSWPPKMALAYGYDYEREKHPKTSARILKRRILHFIKTNGAE